MSFTSRQFKILTTLYNGPILHAIVELCDIVNVTDCSLPRNKILYNHNQGSIQCGTLKLPTLQLPP